MDGTLICTSTPDQSGNGSKDTEKVHLIFKIPRIGREVDLGFMAYQPQRVIQCQAEFVHVYNMYNLKTNSS